MKTFPASPLVFLNHCLSRAAWLAIGMLLLLPTRGSSANCGGSVAVTATSKGSAVEKAKAEKYACINARADAFKKAQADCRKKFCPGDGEECLPKLILNPADCTGVSSKEIISGVWEGTATYADTFDCGCQEKPSQSIGGGFHTVVVGSYSAGLGPRPQSNIVLFGPNSLSTVTAPPGSIGGVFFGGASTTIAFPGRLAITLADAPDPLQIVVRLDSFEPDSTPFVLGGHSVSIQAVTVTTQAISLRLDLPVDNVTGTYRLVYALSIDGAPPVSVFEDGFFTGTYDLLTGYWPRIDLIGHFRFPPVLRIHPAVQVSWLTAINKAYQVLGGPTPSGPWAPVGLLVPGTGEQAEACISVTDGHRFFIVDEIDTPLIP